MGIHVEMVDMEQVFENLNHKPIFANDYDVSDPDQHEALCNVFLMQYSSDHIEIDASCSCGEIRGSYNEGITCPNCNSEVTSTADQQVESNIWLRAPKGVNGLILPEAYVILQKKLTQSSFSYLNWLIDRSYVPDTYSTNDTAVRDRERMAAKFGEHRDLNYFIANFPDILKFILNETAIVKTLKERQDLFDFCQENQHLFFPRVLAIPSRLCFVVEKTNTGIYIDKNLNSGIGAVITIATASSPRFEDKPRMVMNRVVKALNMLGDFYRSYFSDVLSQKVGTFRKHIFGSRLHFTGRAVITSLSEPHHYQDLHIPYGLGVQLLKYHIINKLLRRGYSANECLEFVKTNTAKTCQLMRDIINELIAETPGGRGFPVALTRNPSLRRGSTQAFYVNVIKEDIGDNTISMSVIVLAEPNADKLTSIGQPFEAATNGTWESLSLVIATQ